MSSAKTIGIVGLGVIGYLAWKRGLLGGSRGLIAQADIAQELTESSELDACGNSPMAASAWLYGSQGVAQATPGGPDATGARIAATIGSGAAQIAGSINPIAGVALGAATLAATTLFSVFASQPPEPVIRLIIAEMPYAWTGRSNNPGAANPGVWALDRCGYKHEVLDFDQSGYLEREIVAVNWKVFSMLPEGEPIESAAEIEHVRMPRPADPAVLRRTLGTDIRFYIGREERLRGPWDADAQVPPMAGSPAMWAAIAGEYEPTYTPSAGEF